MVSCFKMPQLSLYNQVNFIKMIFIGIAKLCVKIHVTWAYFHKNYCLGSQS